MRRVGGYKGGGKTPQPMRKKLGNRIARWLAWFGITKARWKWARGNYRVIGGCGTAMLVKMTDKECGCRKRQRELNRVGSASRKGTSETRGRG